MAAAGPRTFSALIATALMTEVERLGTTYNDGHPFRPSARANSRRAEP